LKFPSSFSPVFFFLQLVVHFTCLFHDIKLFAPINLGPFADFFTRKVSFGFSAGRPLRSFFPSSFQIAGSLHLVMIASMKKPPPPFFSLIMFLHRKLHAFVFTLSSTILVALPLHVSALFPWLFRHEEACWSLSSPNCDNPFLQVCLCRQPISSVFSSYSCSTLHRDRFFPKQFFCVRAPIESNPFFRPDKSFFFFGCFPTLNFLLPPWFLRAQQNAAFFYPEFCKMLFISPPQLPGNPT